MHPDQVDFQQLKERVSIEQVLSHYDLRLKPAGSGTLRGPCPLPTHTSRASTDSFSVQLGRNVWSCHSASCMAARQGRVGGIVLVLVGALERCSLRQAGMCLQNWLGAAASRRAPMHPAPATPDLTNPPLRFRLHNIDCEHPYLTQRGISLATAHTFGVGLYSGPGFLAGRLVVPIHDHSGQLIAYAGRSLTGEQPKYRFPAGFRKSQVLFNFHRAIHTGTKPHHLGGRLLRHHESPPGRPSQRAGINGIYFLSTPVGSAHWSFPKPHPAAGWGPSGASSCRPNHPISAI